MNRPSELNADLAAAPRADVIALAERLGEGRAVDHLQVPQEGLWLLRLAEPVRGDRFFLGEVPVASACIGLRDPGLGEARGGAAIIGGDREQAVAAAVCDAVLSAGWPGADEVGRMAALGAAARREAAARRAAILERTRVDFNELGQEGA